MTWIADVFHTAAKRASTPWRQGRLLNMGMCEGTSASDGGPSPQEDLLGAALVDTTFEWPKWVYRRVDSIHPLEGEIGRRRHSIDCAPPPDPRLSYFPDHRTLSSLTDTNGLVMVPLTYIAKGPLRNFDAERSDGTKMPVLGAAETTQAGVAMILYLLKIEKVTLTDELTAALTEIVGPSTGPSNFAEVEKFISTGIWRGLHRVDSEKLNTGEASRLIKVLTEKFLLIGLVEAQHTGERQILKFSYHWHVEANVGHSLWKTIQVASRISSRTLALPLDAPAASRSYHLEFHAPKEVECILMTLPGDSTQGHREDDSHMSVAHTHGTFDNEPDDDATVIFKVAPRGPYLAALLAALFCTAIVLSALLLPDAKSVWRSNPDGPATTLLTAPALLFTFLASKGESALLRRPLGVLRFLIGSSAGSLFLIAASLVGQLQNPWLSVLWWAIAVWNALISILLMTGYIKDYLGNDSVKSLPLQSKPEMTAKIL